MTTSTPHSPTDLGNARRFVEQHGADLRYVGPWGWLLWDDRRWARDETGEVMRRAKGIPGLIQIEALKRPPGTPLRKILLQHALRSESRDRLKAMVELAQTEPGIVLPAGAFDADPGLLNVANGTLDLRTGELRPHRREDLIAKLAQVEYHPSASLSAWAAFLARIQPDPDVRGFVQRMLGSALVGGNLNQKLILGVGAGANGKTVFATVLRRTLGGYAATCDVSTLLAGKDNTGPRPDLTRLIGVRLLFISEIGAGRHLDEALVKGLTGGDPLVARTHYREPVEFVPGFTPVLLANHAPVIRDASHGMWRRVLQVPFTVTIPPDEQDPHLADALDKERSGILNWLIEGCLAWQREGLGAPPAVIEATAEYRETSDALAGFLAERCVVDADVSCPAGDLYRACRAWAEVAGEKAMSQRRFEQMLAERGFKLDRTGRPRVWIGLDLRSDKPDASLDPVRYAVPFSPPRRNGEGTPIQDADIPKITRRLGKSG